LRVEYGDFARGKFPLEFPDQRRGKKNVADPASADHHQYPQIGCATAMRFQGSQVGQPSARDEAIPGFLRLVRYASVPFAPFRQIDLVVPEQEWPQQRIDIRIVLGE
jgi:hypothetical protein